MKDVKNCHQVSVRVTGKRFDVDMHVALDSNLRFEDVHRIATDIEGEVKNIVANARVTVHTEPFESGRESVWKLVKEVAEGVAGSRGVHNIHVQRIQGKLCVDLHLEVSPVLTVKQAHDIADQVERKLREVNPDISEITIHMESASTRISRELTGQETELRRSIEHVAEGFPEIKGVHVLRITKTPEGLHIDLQCRFAPNTNMDQAHDVSSKLEKAVKAIYPNVQRIDIHEEPA